MSTAKTLTYLQYASGRNQAFRMRGKNWVRATAALPSGLNNCSVTNIPMFSPGSVVRVVQQAVSGATSKIQWMKANSTYGDVGTIFFGTKDGSAVTGDTAFMFEVSHY